jgi:hypothetical protein
MHLVAMSQRHPAAIPEDGKGRNRAYRRPHLGHNAAVLLIIDGAPSAWFSVAGGVIRSSGAGFSAN